MNVELDDEQRAVLIRELAEIVEGDPYPFSPRISTLRDILGKLRAEPERPPLPPVKYYDPPQQGRYRRRR
jgi:hypothetical protein